MRDWRYKPNKFGRMEWGRDPAHVLLRIILKKTMCGWRLFFFDNAGLYKTYDVLTPYTGPVRYRFR